jgi:hypothetical protein
VRYTTKKIIGECKQQGLDINLNKMEYVLVVEIFGNFDMGRESVKSVIHLNIYVLK